MGAVAVGFGLLAALVIAAALLVQRSAEFSDLALHTRDVETRLQEAASLFERAEAARRGYLLRQDDAFLQVHSTAATALAETVDDVARLTADNPVQRRRLADLREVLSIRSGFRERSLGLARQGRVFEARAAFDAEASAQTVLRTRTILNAMIAEEDGLLQSRSEEQANSRLVVYWMIAAIAPLLFLLAAGTIWALYRYTSDLGRSRDALRRLNMGLEDAVAARTAELREANEEIQRFAYIVSHDLRSPLVNVMGFTSEIEAGLPALRALLDQPSTSDHGGLDAREIIEVELPEAIGFIRTSTAKMDRLINAILRLSREGRRVLTPERLNMQVLMDGVVSNLKQKADAAGAKVQVRWPMPDIINDRLAMEQVFGNLVDNALKYGQPGRAGDITIAGRADGARVVFEVLDNGRGIDPRDHGRVFDLFRRSGAQDQPGEGIGLAHVRALVQRLGGSIALESALGQGTVFRVSLPPVIKA